MKRWTQRQAQTFYKELALENIDNKTKPELLAKVREYRFSFPSVVGEVYKNNKTYTIYRGQDVAEAKVACERYF